MRPDVEARGGEVPSPLPKGGEGLGEVRERRSIKACEMARFDSSPPTLSSLEEEREKAALQSQQKGVIFQSHRFRFFTLLRVPRMLADL